MRQCGLFTSASWPVTRPLSATSACIETSGTSQLTAIARAGRFVASWSTMTRYRCATRKASGVGASRASPAWRHIAHTWTHALAKSCGVRRSLKAPRVSPFPVQMWEAPSRCSCGRR